ncbi:MAG: 30S ribosome-binding factor RbfA [Clostridiales bacterium]|nr:30S ribosome-binding factor RbfA [Clostridiales bacterium]
MKSRSTSHRTERVASVIKRNVAVIIETEISDPRIHGVSVVDVSVSPDLRYATVWVYIYGNDEDVLDALRNSAGFVRRLLSEQMSEMRVIPQIRFELDKSQSYYERIDKVIKGLHDGESN